MPIPRARRDARWAAPLALLVGCGASAAAPSAPADVDGETGYFVDEDGNVTERTRLMSWSPLGLADDVLVLRCRLSTEGRFFGCTRIRGPRVVEDQFVAAIGRLRVEPVRENGRAVEAVRVVSIRVRFVAP